MDVCETVKLRKAENSGLQDVAIFCRHCVLKLVLLASALSGDFQFLKYLNKYKTVDEKVATAAFKNVAGHLSYLGDELVALAFFHRSVSCDEKQHMIQALQSAGSKDIPKRVLNVDEDTLEKKNLHDFITSTFCGESHFLDALQILNVASV